MKGVRQAPLERFHEKYLIDPETGCWVWTDAPNSRGYGRLWVDGVRVYAHRFSHEQFIGPIPVGYEVDHVRARGCTTRLCVNPAHLEAVTPRENQLRGETWLGLSERAEACTNGHPWTGDNTYRRRDTGTRMCRACMRANQSRLRQRRALTPASLNPEGAPTS